MNFNHDTGSIDTFLTIDTTVAPPLGGQTNVLVVTGTGAIQLPGGATGSQPGTPAAGMLRYNSSNSNLEFYNTGWNALSTGGGTVSSITVTTTTGQQVSGGTTQTITGSGTFALTLGTELQGLSALAANGMIARTTTGTYAARTITGTASNIVVTNGDGIAGAPTINLATVTQGSTGTSFLKVQLDTLGRVINNTAVVAADITTLVDATYVNVSGDSMSSAANLTFSGGGEVLGLPATPTTSGSAASKAYVDATAQGLTPKQAVLAATTTNGTLATSFANGQVIDGITLATGNRILLKNQTTTADNGIYTVNATGAPTRALDMNTWANVPSAYTFVETGTTLADTAWVCTSDPGGTLNTTAITFVQFGGAGTYTNGTGLTLTGNVFSLTSPVTPALGGTGTTTAPSAVGQLLIATSGNVYTPATLTQGTAMTITNASGSITITNNGVTALAGTANQITASAATGSITLSTPATFIAPGSIASTSTITAATGLTVTAGGATITAGALNVTAGLTYLSSNATVSAAGSTQGTATALTTNVNNVTTVAASTGVVLPTPTGPGTTITVINKGANPLTIYPASGGAIDAGSTNTGFSLPVGGLWTGTSTSTTQWYSVEQEIVAGSAISVVPTEGILTINNTGVTSIAGTANQITLSGATGAVTVSLPSSVTITTGLTVSGLTANSFLYSGTAGLLTTTSAPTNGQLLIGSTGAAPVAATLTAGTGMSVSNTAGTITLNNTGVTSVAMSVPSFLSVAGSPITTTGTLAVTLATQTTNTVFVAPNGSTGTPTFRQLLLADLTASAIKLYLENPSTPTAPTAGGANAVAIGSGSAAGAIGAVAFGDGSSGAIWGGKVNANGKFATAGDAQAGLYVLRNLTTTATVTELYLDGVAATQRLVIGNNSVFTFSILVAARRTDAVGGGAGYKVEGAIRKDTTAASATLIGAVTKSILGETNAAWDVTVTADTTNGSLKVAVTGEAAKTIRWVATVTTSEVTN